MIEIKTPVFPESVADGEIAAWHVQVGEGVNRDQILVDIETDKVVLEVVAPSDGKVTEILKAEGETVLAEEVLAMFEAGEVAEKATEADLETITDTPEVDSLDEATASASPAARKIAEEQKLDVTSIVGTGKGSRVTKEDVLKAVAAAEGQMQVTSAVSTPVEVPVAGDRIERRVPMTRLRASVARRLLEAQETAAMLTTFNEVDMTAIIELRSQYKDDFAKIHNGTRLGFMSFFVRASIEALKRFPAVNASIDGNDIVYHGYQDIGVAVGSPRGLVVPVLRDADSLTLAEIETQVSDYGRKAQDNKLSIDDMTGGTFTISNGGVFGSLLSTPILNPPQTGILGMHKIQDRPMAVSGEVKIRPMMYLALSYDHRLIDGQEAVRFLVTIKDFLEEPARILLDI
ncbi:MAG: 2-oxoglutarate dehydrogenase complex dihydrolipoyllysine-residue succinyltransferase [Pseudomonadales bacterium]|nr:2-oxoglutarate dehydrogenase complex dihydrolipoyllysine-residue succinyltransferase [Pseudomonadales bacterium]MDG1003172.1 2-oxoglutarate dehydrogenase complex dihydrolipoyllysine-residue succinyltransferase [Pseudomonadales bacterium]MDG1304348.1 2-oxoglutarate dehydrogenase complex dihydrolipoyllysine-residue succinyltransferase [Pseudomonadales bacterium]MDG1835651.1 2-oxoglutarate dehydrogenase complex dihydrolipoyllysine-residue succinyltransferase [Pseudomonadales bacterium]MDG190816|tara:strand:+ start:868 stop:2073 length:1206 start_codon:yes stop_codon:yes gene_type:complete